MSIWRNGRPFRGALAAVGLGLLAAACGDRRPAPDSTGPAAGGQCASRPPAPEVERAPARAAPATTNGSAAAQSQAPALEKTEHGILLHAVASEKLLPPFSRVNDATAAGGVAVQVAPRAGTEPGGLELPFDIEKAGPCLIWIRAFWGTDGEDACSNSVYLQVDGKVQIQVQDGTYRSWHWVVARFTGNPAGWIDLGTGAHRLRLENREDGIKIDQIYIIPWEANEMDRYVPQGIES
jgi:hypothetical protein